MRFFLVIIVVICLIACQQSVKGKNGVTYKSAVSYNDYIINRQTKLMKNVVEFGKMIDTYPDSAQVIIEKSAIEVEKIIDEVKGMPPYKGDSALRDVAVQSFIFYKKLFEKDYPAVLAIRKKGQENITSDEAIEYNRILENISKEEEVLEKAFHNAQQEYAEKNNMKLIDNKEQKDQDKMNKE